MHNYQYILSGIIDSHAHVVSEFFPDDQEQVIQRSLAANIKYMVNPGVDLKSIPELITLAQKHKQIYIGVGLHPHDADQWSDVAEETIRKAAEHPKVVAIGECGLDFHFNNASPEAQLKALRQQIQIIHCRNAFDEMKEILKKEGKGLKGVFHCFTGSPAILESLADFDFYISFSGIVTFPNAKDIQAAATLVSDDRLLVETDCPFLAPQKVRGQKNEPAFVWMVAEKLAELRSTKLDQIAEICSNNARRLFGLPEAEI